MICISGTVDCTSKTIVFVARGFSAKKRGYRFCGCQLEKDESSAGYINVRKQEMPIKKGMLPLQSDT